MSTISERYIKDEVKNSTKLVVCWTITLWLIVMNTTMFNVAVPNIIQQFQLNAEKGSLLIACYTCFFSVSTVVFSRLSNTIAIKSLVKVSLIGVGFASIIGFFATNFYMLIIARIIQASFGGCITALGTVVVIKYIPFANRVKSLGIIASGTSIAFGLGPIVGGILNRFFGWQALFGVTCFVLFMLPQLDRLLPNDGFVGEYRFDYRGTFYLLVTIFLALTMFIYKNLLIAILLLLGTFCIYKHCTSSKNKNPLIDMKVLLNTKFLKILKISIPVYIIHFTLLFILPLMLFDKYTLTSLEIGLIMFPGAMLPFLLNKLISKQFQKYKVWNLMFIAIIMYGCALLGYLILDVYPFILLIVVYMFTAIGFSLLSMSFSLQLTNDFLPLELGIAMGLLYLVQLFFGALGTALCGIIINYPLQWMLTNYQTVFSYLLAILLIPLIVVIRKIRYRAT